MTVLALETSCDETSAAVVQNGTVLAHTISSQIQMHAEYGGVVPELAAREHQRNLPWIVRNTLQEAERSVSQIDLIAATRGPGLPNALIAGFKFAQAMAFASAKPFCGIHHHEAHLYSPWAEGEPLRARFDQFQPNLSLIISGGHTLLIHVPALLRHEVLGATLDDAAGECFDKCAKLLGLPYPGGPEIDRLAERGQAKAHAFPRPMLSDSSDDFSFSGLKTAVRYFVRDHPEVLEKSSALFDLCAGIQAAIVDVLIIKTMRAAIRLGVPCVTASGGVSVNGAFRRQLTQACAEHGVSLRLVHPALGTDNAAMIGILAEQRWRRRPQSDDLNDDILPGWKLSSEALCSSG